MSHDRFNDKFLMESGEKSIASIKVSLHFSDYHLILEWVENYATISRLLPHICTAIRLTAFVMHKINRYILR